MLPRLCLVLLAPLVLAGCAKKAAPVAPPAGDEGEGASALADVHTGRGLTKACDEYRRKLLLCMQSDHFPKEARDGERLALEQMLSQIRQEQSQKENHMEAVKAADENCRISIFNMKESGKESCPGVF